MGISQRDMFDDRAEGDQIMADQVTSGDLKTSLENPDHALGRTIKYMEFNVIQHVLRWFKMI